MLDCEHDKIEMVMKEAQAVGMMTAYHNYLITNMVRSKREDITEISCFSQLVYYILDIEMPHYSSKT